MENWQYEKAKEIVLGTPGTIYISRIQRELRIGFNRADRFLQRMVGEGILSVNHQSGNYERVI